MCRIFQKSATVKKPQQTTSSQQSLDSPCDTNTMVNEFGHFDHLPNLNNIANSSTMMNNISLQNYTNENNLNMPINTLLPSSLSWPSGLLSSNLSMNSLLLKALQFKNYQQREITSSTNLDYTSFMPQGISTPYGTDFTPNFAASSSTSKGLDNSLQQQQEHQEQPFNLDSIW